MSQTMRERAAPAPDIERCERETGVCVQVHSAERLGPCTPENCRYTAAPAPDADAIMALAEKCMPEEIAQAPYDALRAAVERVIAERDDWRRTCEEHAQALIAAHDEDRGLLERAERAEAELISTQAEARTMKEST